MTTEEIRQTFDEVQTKLDTLQNEKATFLFIGNEGNHFAMGGNQYMIAAQLTFSMMRYPVVRDIIKQCAANYDELNAAFGKEARDKIMDHQIEQNSGRK